MTIYEDPPVFREESEELQDEEAAERFDDESPTGTPISQAADDPEDSPEQPNDEA